MIQNLINSTIVTIQVKSNKSYICQKIVIYLPDQS